jgi:hypothetical protein
VKPLRHLEVPHMNHATNEAKKPRSGRALGGLALACVLALSTGLVGCATTGAKGERHAKHAKKTSHHLAGNTKVKNYSLDNGRANPDWLRRGRAALPTAFD